MHLQLVRSGIIVCDTGIYAISLVNKQDKVIRIINHKEKKCCACDKTRHFNGYNVGCFSGHSFHILFLL